MITEEVCPGLEISVATYHRWSKESGGASMETVFMTLQLVDEITDSPGETQSPGSHPRSRERCHRGVQGIRAN